MNQRDYSFSKWMSEDGKKFHEEASFKNIRERLSAEKFKRNLRLISAALDKWDKSKISGDEKILG